MVEELKGAMKDIIDEAEWMDESTKEKAKLKVMTMMTLICTHF